MELPPQHGRQFRCLVAATTQKRAAELVDETIGAFRSWWCTTGNDLELSVATEEGVWYAPMQGAKTAEDYRRFK